MLSTYYAPYAVGTVNRAGGNSCVHGAFVLGRARKSAAFMEWDERGRKMRQGRGEGHWGRGGHRVQVATGLSKQARRGDVAVGTEQVQQ